MARDSLHFRYTHERSSMPFLGPLGQASRLGFIPQAACCLFADPFFGPHPFCKSQDPRDRLHSVEPRPFRKFRCNSCCSVIRTICSVGHPCLGNVRNHSGNRSQITFPERMASHCRVPSAMQAMLTNLSYASILRYTCCTKEL